MKKLNVGTLGPEGTFSQEATEKICHRFRTDYNIIFESTISKVFASLTDQSDVIVVPLENIEAGSVVSTLNNLLKYQNLKIIGELDLRIRHNLGGFGSIKGVSHVYAHPQSHAQSEDYLDTELNNVNIIHTASNSESAIKLTQHKNPAYAAILPDKALTMYNIPVLKADIQNNNDNITRFIAIAHDETINRIGLTNKGNKTSILVDPRKDHPGLLFSILEIFAKNNINLSKIESRPSKRKLGDYVFFIDISGNRQMFENCREQLERITNIRLLGSYNNLEDKNEPF